jgi:GNAT superfamily N-acetyltransferase
MSNFSALTYSNLVETYFALANAIVGTNAEIGDGWVACRNPMAHASCNFGIACSVESISSARLEEFIGNRSTFHLYSFCKGSGCDGDDRWATRMGFRHGSTLAALAIQPNDVTPAPKVHLQFAESESERNIIAEKIALQFFPRQSQSARQVIVMATVGSGLPLAHIIHDKKSVGAIMLCKTVGAFGVYNFFIEERFRRLGIGTQTMLAVADMARSEDCIVCLQCELSLIDWYESKGFIEVGHVDIWALDHFETVAIIG